MKLYILSLITSYYLSVSSVVKGDDSETTVCIPDYYWRDYFGKIPEDAIIGGRSPAGEPFYIGQAYIRFHELLPVTIYPDRKKAVGSSYLAIRETDTHVKILCSPYKQNFVWMKTKSENLKLITEYHIIPGGSEWGEPLYIGRVFHENKIVLGKVHEHHSSIKGIWIPSGITEKNLQEYEVLIYKCKNNDIAPQ